MTNTNNDEIDLIETLHILWSKKRTICIFTLVAFLSGIGFAVLDTPIYQSRVNYSVIAPPPFKSNLQTLQDFELLFFSKKAFENWKTNYSNTTLVFDDVSTTNVVNGYNFTKNINEQLIKNSQQNNLTSTLVLKTNHFPVLSDIFEYATFVDRELSDKYYQMAKDELKIIKMQHHDLLINSDQAFLSVLALHRYLSNMDKEFRTFIISAPSQPELISQNRYMILVISTILGAISGVLIVLIYHFFNIRTAQ